MNKKKKRSLASWRSIDNISLSMGVASFLVALASYILHWYGVSDLAPAHAQSGMLIAIGMSAFAHGRLMQTRWRWILYVLLPLLSLLGIGYSAYAQSMIQAVIDRSMGLAEFHALVQTIRVDLFGPVAVAFLIVLFARYGLLFNRGQIANYAESRHEVDTTRLQDDSAVSDADTDAEELKNENKRSIS